MIRKKLCSVRCRYMSIMLISIFIFIYINHRGDLYNFFTYKNCGNLVLNELSDLAKKYIYLGKEKGPEALNVTELRHWILTQNAQEKVLNLDLYGPLTANTLIFVVLVQQYSCNINYLLASFSQVEGIEDTLIIFSHSYVDHHLNRLLQSIEFSRVLQLFYPYSIQVYPDVFPGYGKNDCPSNLNMKAAEKLNCTSAMTPDVNGHYRNPINAVAKHHWWWTANKVFGNLSCTIGHNGLVIFLDDNYYLYKNLIYIANKMKNIAETLPHWDFLSLGSTLEVMDDNVYGLEFTTWSPKYHCNILAISVSAWASISSHYDIFCRTDDYSWSRSLFEVSINRRDGTMFKVLSSLAATALQTSCTSIEDIMDCRVVKNIVKIIHLENVNEKVLFPSYFEIRHDIDLYDDDFISENYIEINGGWNDQRDKQLCSNMTINKVSKHYETTDNKLTLDTYY